MQLPGGTPFPALARQFSQSPSAATGGDMGWIYDGQLAPELNADLAKMEVGEISPSRSVRRAAITFLSARAPGAPGHQDRTDVPTGPTGPAGTLKLARLLFPLPIRTLPRKRWKARKAAARSGELCRL